MKRCLLHKTKLQAFKDWCEREGIQTRAGKGDYQVLQVKTPNGWQVVFERAEMPEHYSLNDRLVPTVHKFIRATRDETR